MCLSTAHASLTNTLLYVGIAQHPQLGEVHVVGYQNTAQNLASGPNAMAFFLPVADRLELLDTSACPGIMRDMLQAKEAGSRRKSRSLSVGKGAQIVEHGIYTVIIAPYGGDIPAALEQVPAHKRPALTPELLAFIAKRINRTTVLCCFDNRDSERATPLFLWYQSSVPGVLVAPAFDGHTGDAPDLTREVLVDHQLIVDVTDSDLGDKVTYNEEIPPALRPFLPTRVIVQDYCDYKMPNGDFILPCAVMNDGNIKEHIRRIPPTDAIAFE